MNETNPVEPSVDEGLALRAAGGDVQAFNILALKWNHRIYNYALRYLGDHDEAREASQETFIKAYKGISKLKRGSQFRSWIYVIAGNTCRDVVKRSARSATMRLEPFHEQLAGDSAREASGRIEKKETTIALKRALALLPEEQRVVLILKEYEELKFSEIAVILEIPESTVKTRLYTAFKTMRKLLENHKDDR